MQRNLPPAGSRLLDLGAAGGDLSALLRSWGYFTAALEPDAQLVALAGDGGAACRGDGRRLPFCDGAFDGAVCIEVLEHVSGAEAVLSELRRVVRPGGSLCVAVPTRYTEAIFSRLHPRYAANARHVRRFGRTEMMRLLAASGFEVVEVRTENLVAALGWLVHSVLRTEADHTGLVLEHRWVDRVIATAAGLWRRAPLLGPPWRLLERWVGKSWYFHGVAT